MSWRRAGAVKALSPARNTKGCEDYQFSIWIGVQASAKTPDAEVAAIHKAAYAGLTNPEMRKSIEASGTVIAKPMINLLAQVEWLVETLALTQAKKYFGIKGIGNSSKPGFPRKYPCISSMPSSKNHLHSALLSTPSAMISMPKSRQVLTMPRTIA